MKKSIYTKEYGVLITWLKAARERSGLSQRGLAKRLKVHPSFVAKIELKERRLDLIEFIRICKVLEVDPADGIQKVARRNSR